MRRRAGAYRGGGRVRRRAGENRRATKPNRNRGGVEKRREGDEGRGRRGVSSRMRDSRHGEESLVAKKRDPRDDETNCKEESSARDVSGRGSARRSTRRIGEIVASDSIPATTYANAPAVGPPALAPTRPRPASSFRRRPASSFRRGSASSFRPRLTPPPPFAACASPCPFSLARPGRGVRRGCKTRAPPPTRRTRRWATPPR